MAPDGEDEEKESIGAKVDPSTKQQIRVQAAKQGQSMSAYIREAVMERLEADLEREGNKNRAAVTAD